jgi:hypothetical protein
VKPALKTGWLKRALDAASERAELMPYWMVRSTRVQEDKFRNVLREHWISGIICDHVSKTDRATCSCSLWRSDPKPNIGAAVDAWIDHVLESI